VADESEWLGRPLTNVEYAVRIPDAFMFPSSISSFEGENGMHGRLFIEASKMDLWEDGFSLLKTYMKREGHCNVHSNYKEDGVILGSWVMRQRHAKKKGRLSTDKERRLEGLGIIWNGIPLKRIGKKGLRSWKRISNAKKGTVIFLKATKIRWSYPLILGSQSLPTRLS
jgi:hypothetical protein